MPNNFVDNKDRWLTIAKGEFDYSIFFIKSWLPFNAWYCNNYPQYNNKDSDILREVKSDHNIFRGRVMAHLVGLDDESVKFRKYLVDLHRLLEKCNVPDAQSKISFISIFFRENQLKVFVKNFRSIDYKLELIIPVAPHFIKIRGVIIKNNLNIFPYQHTKYELQHLQNDTQFLNLSAVSKQIIIDGFKQIDPKFKENLIVSRRRDAIATISDPLFLNDTDLVSQALIEILYRLRCILFHGEIQPSKDNLEIYEPAYYMLRILLKSLY